MSLAFHVENILVIVDISRLGGDFQPFVHRMDLAHTLKVHHQHTSLEVAVCVAHMQLLTHVLRALAVLHIEIADEIDIRHCADRMVAEFGVEQFGDVAVDHQIAIQIQQLRIERQRLLDDEAVVAFRC